MQATPSTWDERLGQLWEAFDGHEAAAFNAAIDQLTAERPAGDAIALFERGCARDSTGRSDLAVPLYEGALAAGLVGLRRRRAVIQLASSLRNLGQATRASELLFAELKEEDDALTGAVHGFLALALADLGREREGLALSLAALARYLPRYNQSLARYAQELQP